MRVLLRLIARCCNNSQEEDIKNDLEIIDKTSNSQVIFSSEKSEPVKKETFDESTIEISPPITPAFQEPEEQPQTHNKNSKKPRKVKHRIKKESQSSWISDDTTILQPANTSQLSTCPIEITKTPPKPLKGILKKR